MQRIAIAGGIGSGKTAVTDYLAQKGIVIVDADVVARQVVVPGEPAYRQLVDAFGRGVLGDDANLNRTLLADVVFRDSTALHRLNRITHLAIGAEILRSCEENADSIVAIALPLYRPEHREIFSLGQVWLVRASEDVVMRRLTTSRGMDLDDARRRIEAQRALSLSDDAFDAIIDNSYELALTHDAVDRLLAELR
jgi:dephospho-CoA kinase